MIRNGTLLLCGFGVRFLGAYGFTTEPEDGSSAEPHQRRQVTGSTGCMTRNSDLWPALPAPRLHRGRFTVSFLAPNTPLPPELRSASIVRRDVSQQMIRA